MEATVAERGQITMPKAVRDALGLTKGTLLKVELDGSRIICRRRSKSEPPCRPNIEPGAQASFLIAGCG